MPRRWWLRGGLIASIGGDVDFRRRPGLDATVERRDQLILQPASSLLAERRPRCVGHVEHVLGALADRHDLGGRDVDAFGQEHLADLATADPGRSPAISSTIVRGCASDRR